MYLKGFCTDFFNQEFATRIDAKYKCPIIRFDGWLAEQYNSSTPVAAYSTNCNGRAGLPVPPDTFNHCVIAWSQLTNESSILQRNGQVRIIMLPYQSRVRYDSRFQVLANEWKLIEFWMKQQQRRGATAPPGANRMYSSSEDFWWYDTNGKMLQTAYGSAGIALVAAAVVMLFTSRSLEMTAMALVTIGFVLLSVTALLVASGWTLGLYVQRVKEYLACTRPFIALRALRTAELTPFALFTAT